MQNTIHDIENNMYEVLKNKIKNLDERLSKLEEKLDERMLDKMVSKWCGFLEGVTLWTLVILLLVKVFPPLKN